AYDASNLLTMNEQFLSDLGKIDSGRVEKLYGQFMYWIGFRRNPADLTLRNQEKNSLLKLLASASEQLSTELMGIFLPSFDIDLGDGSLRLKEALRKECMAIVAPKAAKEAISFMTRDGGIQSLTERGRFAAVRYCLFKSDSPVWTTDLRNELIALIRKGDDDPKIYSNVSDLFDLVMWSLKGGVDSPIDRSDAVALLSDQEFIKALWNTVNTRAIQYRMQMSYIEGRQLLIQNGVPEAILPLTDELKQRLEEDARLRASRQTATS
ncbi:MAG: hypothetical protein WCA92_06710, partial [Terriglobales bacterium]